MRLFTFICLLMLSGCPAARSASPTHAGPSSSVPDRTISFILGGSTPLSPWVRGQVRRPDGPALDLYLVRDARPRPLLVLLQGSNCLPLFGSRIRPDGRRSQISSNPFLGNERKLSSSVHLAVVERHGVASFGPPIPASLWPPPRVSPACAERAYDKRLRVRDVADVVLALASQPWVTRVLIAGHSEGSDIATGVARLLGTRQVAAVGLFGGAGGASQLFESAVLERKAGRSRGAVATMHDLLWLQAHRRETGIHEGVDRYPVRRWVSFALDSTPLDDLRGLALPVFVAHGSADLNVPVETADLFVIERLRAGYQSLAYRSVEGVDHGFHCAGGKESLPGLLSDFLRFALRPPAAPDLQHLAPCSSASEGTSAR